VYKRQLLPPQEEVKKQLLIKDGKNFISVVGVKKE